MIVLVSILLSNTGQLIPQAKADQGNAKVYVLQLAGVGAWWVDDTSRVRAGVIDACTPAGEHGNMPRAHPLFGESPAFYEVSYSTIYTWADYVDVILNQIGVIVVNAHGEILPVPTEYNNTQWANCIAEAMWKRRLTWAHMAGYPFYWVWHQGDTQKTLWGKDGFKTLMGNIGLPNVEIPTDLTEHKAELTGAADQNLASQNWVLYNATHVKLIRPLKVSDFKNCAVLPLYERAVGEEYYWEGAVIAFAKCGQRIDEETYGSGYFVHLGTDQTYDGSNPPQAVGNKDYMLGYVVAAAALWADTSKFETQKAFVSNGLESRMETALGIAPCIAGYWYEEQTILNIRLVFGIFGSTIRSTGTSHSIQNVVFQIFGLLSDCNATHMKNLSREGEGMGTSLKNLVSDSDYTYYGLQINGVLELLGFISEVADYLPFIGGAILFSDWMRALGDAPDSPGSDVCCVYTPTGISTLTQDQQYTIEEFESLIVVDLSIPTTSRQEWRIIPLDYCVQLETTSEYSARVNCRLSIAAFFDPGDNVMVFFDDFQDSNMQGWNIVDRDSSCGHDYWGCSAHLSSYELWCAQVGTNSLNGETPNIEVLPNPVYDDGMNASMERAIDLRSFNSADLTFCVKTELAFGDYLVAEYYLNNIWNEIPGAIYQNDYGPCYDSYTLDTNATKIRFRFISNLDHQVALGAFLDNIEIKAWLDNDAFSGHDAGSSQSLATYIPISSTQTNWAGYLDGYDDIYDCYNFTITSSDISNGKEICIGLYSPQAAQYSVALYDPNGNMKAQSPYGFHYHLQATDVNGTWALKISDNSGFDQYNFDLQLRTYAPGGCPKLFVWDGTTYSDFGVIDIHNPAGEDVIKEVSIPTESVGISNYQACLRLIEGWEGLHYSHSEIDQVKLYAVIDGNRFLCPLIYAHHNASGNVLLQLWFSDDWKVDAYLLETIDFKFLVPYQNIQGYVFVIEGCDILKEY
jgi:hypothetical protein